MTPTRTGTPTRTPIFTVTPTNTPRTIGGEITAFGVARADGRVVDPIGPDMFGNPVYGRPPSGFIIYVEAAPGVSHLPVGTVTFRSNSIDPNVLPDLQLVTSLPLGNGSAAVCDDGPPPFEPIGGVPAVEPVVFVGSQATANAINDLSCRFDARTSSTLACTRDASQTVSFIGSGSTVQFCTTSGVGTEIAFPIGETKITARVLDVVGQPGHEKVIWIRVLGD